MTQTSGEQTSDEQTSAAGTVPPRQPRIVVGVDGSEQSRLALARAVELAGQMGASLEPVSVWQYPPVPQTSMLSDWSPERDAVELLQQCLEEQFGGEVPEWVRPHVSAGPPARTLIESSRGADLLVVGSRGHGGFVGLLLGSVSSACAEYAYCPVLIMRRTTPSL
jgi:nucleotide-binding universal stress UspA family protein